MRFMMFMYPEISEADWNPSAEEVAAMGRYNEEMRKAGMLLALDGLHPPAEGASVSFDGEGVKAVTDGPFAEAKEVVGGYWLIQARSKDEAVEWAKRCPGRDCRIEVRRVFEMEDFPADVQAAVAGD
ncbi:MAG TPA: YciI family protein [Solirubrobacterales bacterium]|nr:YciI family protein [Solirubrobacterales bacterium]